MSDDKLIRNQCEKMYQAGAHQIVFTGAHGTGKTYTAVKFARDKVLEAYGACHASDNEKGELYARHICIVPFHSAYDYGDFMEELRPVLIENNMAFVRMDGNFKAFCRRIAEDRERYGEKPYFFIIDGINRADISRVFGELLYCLDEDGRGSGNRVCTKYCNLPYYPRHRTAGYGYDEWDDGPVRRDVFENGFYIPENLYILATMNDIDSFGDPFDYALRRRFKWIEANADLEADAALKTMLEHEMRKRLARSMPDREQGEIEKLASAEIRRISGEIAALAEKIKKLNAVIAGGSGREGTQSLTPGEKLGFTSDYHIGHAWFRSYTCDGKTDNLQEIWDTQLSPILREYCLWKDAEGKKAFLDACREALGVS